MERPGCIALTLRRDMLEATMREAALRRVSVAGLVEEALRKELERQSASPAEQQDQEADAPGTPDSQGEGGCACSNR